MPISEAHVCTLFVTSLVRIEEEPQLRLSRDAAALRGSICGEVVVRREHRPMLRDLHRHGAVQCAHLHFAVLLDPAWGQRDVILSLAPVEGEEVRVGHRPPFDAEGADFHSAQGALVVPPERVVAYSSLELREQVAPLGIVVPYSQRAGPECHGGHGGGGECVPLCGKMRPGWHSETGWGQHA